MQKLLFTGASGFLGYNTRHILEKTYDVHTIGLTDDDDIKFNIAKDVPPINTHYDVVLHAAGKAHTVPKTEAEKQVFYDVNYHGTVNLCKALENAGVPKALVFISTVAVYGCEFGDLVSEEHPLEGTSPYAESKIMAEKYLTEWCEKHGVILGILRPSLLAGRKAPGNLGAMVNGIKKGFYLNIAGGKVKKSILMAEDIAHLLPLLVEKGECIMSVIPTSLHSERLLLRLLSNLASINPSAFPIGWLGVWLKGGICWDQSRPLIHTN